MSDVPAPDLERWLTDATLLFAALKLLPVAYLMLDRKRAMALFEDRLAASLYFTSKLSGILAVAFALGAAASAGRQGETMALALLLVVAGGMIFWSIFARITGRFYGFAGLGRPPVRP